MDKDLCLDLNLALKDLHETNKGHRIFGILRKYIKDGNITDASIEYLESEQTPMYITFKKNNRGRKYLEWDCSPLSEGVIIYRVLMTLRYIESPNRWRGNSKSIGPAFKVCECCGSIFACATSGRSTANRGCTKHCKEIIKAKAS